MDLNKKISLAIIKDGGIPSPLLSDYCAGHIRLSDLNKSNLNTVCDDILFED